MKMDKHTLNTKEIIKNALWKAELCDKNNCDYFSDLPDIHFSEKFESQVNELEKMSIKIDKKHKLNKNLLKIMGVAAAIVCLILLLSNKSVQANIRELVEFSYKDHDVRTEIEYDVQHDYPAPEFLEEKYIPSWIPDGYAIDSTNWYDMEDTTICSAVYKNTEGEKISFIQATVYVEGSKETEGAIIKQVDINGNKGRLYTNLGLNGLFWTDEKYAYSINYDYLTDEDVIEIAKSIILYEKE